MRRLTYFVLLLAGLYSGYWFIGQSAVERGVRDAITQARADGWQISYGRLDTIGFPSRFDTTITEPVLSPPDGVWRWDAPFLQVFALSYQPNRIIAAFSNEQALRVGAETVQISSSGLRLSAGVKAATDLAFDAATAEVGASMFASDAGWDASLQRALIAVRAQAHVDAAYDVYLGADQLQLPDGVVAQIDPNRQLGQTVSRVVVDSAITLDYPLDRHTFDGTGPTPRATKFVLRELIVDWGDVTVRGSGRFDIDATGVLDGRITLVSAEWRQMIDLLVVANVIDAGIAPTVTNLASAMAAADGTLDLPVLFRDGTMFLGPIPIGPAPRLY